MPSRSTHAPPGIVDDAESMPASARAACSVDCSSGERQGVDFRLAFRKFHVDQRTAPAESALMTRRLDRNLCDDADVADASCLGDKPAPRRQQVGKLRLDRPRESRLSSRSLPAGVDAHFRRCWRRRGAAHAGSSSKPVERVGPDGQAYICRRLATAGNRHVAEHLDRRRAGVIGQIQLHRLGKARQIGDTSTCPDRPAQKRQHLRVGRRRNCRSPRAEDRMRACAARSVAASTTAATMDCRSATSTLIAS